ncbi:MULTISPECIES: hypothetical protein [unclassified Helicobacter]|uniref:hypothetical protein n=1 Tax=unclassified Helicobacter TaxID=2593540 RepID=UPI0012E88E37|nr:MULTISPECIES: hypothetical protein [unclassified Helicobacter]
MANLDSSEAWQLLAESSKIHQNLKNSHRAPPPKRPQILPNTKNQKVEKATKS